jgi:hypothetical protein
MSEQLIDTKPDRSAGRPFPWFCPRCRRKEVRRTTMPYDCQRSHNGEPVTVHVPALAVPRCGNCGELVFDYVAEEQIKEALQRLIQASSLHDGAALPAHQPDELSGASPDRSQRSDG